MAKHDHSDHSMGKRGVTRPMAEMQGQESDQHHDHSSGHEMSHDVRMEMLRSHHQQTAWIYWTLPMIGVWLLVAPFTFGYLNEAQWVQPSGGRGAWLYETPSQDSLEFRAWLMTYSDLVCGVLLIILGWRSITPDRPKSLWACCFVGVWLTFAPIVLWAPTAASYLNDSFVGILVMALTILIPGMPNMIMYMQHGPAMPPGWSYNPSSWAQRWVMIVTGFLGFIVSRYLAVFQLGYVDYVWDPFFGFESGTKPVLNSSLSHTWPISDAGLGGISYTFEFLMGYMGSPSRWRTMPWMVAFFGVLVIPLGLTHILLVISQPVVVHHWCSMCILAALIMLPMIPLEVDEVVAMCQHVIQAKRRGDRGGSLWNIFWKGGTAEGCTMDKRSPALLDFPRHPGRLFLASIWGMSFPWTLVVSAILGVALMFVPNGLGIPIETFAADVGHLGGALLVTISVIAMGEVVRAGRYLNLLVVIFVIAGSWLAEGSTLPYAIVCSLLAALVIPLTIPRGPQKESYGTWNRYIR